MTVIQIVPDPVPDGRKVKKLEKSKGSFSIKM